MIKQLILVSLLATGGIRAMAQTSYVAPDLDDRKAHQKTMAILPALAPIPFSRRQLKDLRPEQLQGMQDSASLTCQRSVYQWFATQGVGNTLEIQDPITTDSLLEAAHLSVKDVIYGEKTQLAQILGVDVLLSASLKSKQDYTQGGMGASPYGGFAPDYDIPTLEVFITIDLYDGQNADRLWGYEGDRDGGYFARYADKKTIDKLLKTAYKQYPYKRKSS
jgi:hypothetical protein